MKRRSCSYSDCGLRRVHWERPEVPRGTQVFEVPDTIPDDRRVYCSMTCALMDGAISLKNDDKKE